MYEEFPLSKVYQLLEPGPVALLTTRGKARGGATPPANVMTLSWHMMVDFTPPLIACVVSSAGHSFAALRGVGECVIGIPGVELAPKVVQVGNSSGRDVDKFKAFGLTPAPSRRVGPPLVAECFANLECTVADTRFVNKYNIFIIEVVMAWINPARKDARTIHHCGHGRFKVDGEVIQLESRMP
jgi:flavin reductase (DIM6/NTAB) family NADH-FMN oxidoreductase RutF